MKTSEPKVKIYYGRLNETKYNAEEVILNIDYVGFLEKNINKYNLEMIMKFRGGLGFMECQSILTEDHVYIYFATDRFDEIYRFAHDDFSRRIFGGREVDEDELHVINNIVDQRGFHGFVNVQKMAYENRLQRLRDRKQTTE